MSANELLAISVAVGILLLVILALELFTRWHDKDD